MPFQPSLADWPILIIIYSHVLVLFFHRFPEALRNSKFLGSLWGLLRGMVNIALSPASEPELGGYQVWGLGFGG